MVGAVAEEGALATSLGEGPPSGGASGAVEGASGDTEEPVVARLTLCVKAA